MGNEQSVPAPRRATNRLSKPRTNTSTNALSSTLGPSPNRRDSILQDGGNRYSIVTEKDLEKKIKEPKKRMSLFRLRSSQVKVPQLDISNGVDIQHLEESPMRRPVAQRWESVPIIEVERERYLVATPKPPVQRAPSQRASIGQRPVRSSRNSLQHVPYSQNQTRLSLVRETHSPQPDSIRHNSIADSPQQAEPPSQTRSPNPSEYVPIRRRSLLQHGVATRNSWVEQNVEDDPRRSLPSQVAAPPPEPSTQYREPKALAPPFPEFDHLRRTVGDYQRVSTPNDLDYSHIGAFKLGSLRIVNGAASPESSRERANTIGGEQDYISAGHARAKSQDIKHNLAQRSQTISVPLEDAKLPWIARAESPLQSVETLETDQHTALTINTHLPLPEFSLFKFSESPTKSLDLAREYQQDIALSPFSFTYSPAISPKLEATSKHTAVEDDLFAAEPTTPDGRSIDSGYRGDVTEEPRQAANAPQEAATKPLAKADSGYSSNVSLRSFKGNLAPKVPAKDAPPTPPKGPVSRVSSSTYSIASSTRSESTIREKRSLPALPKDSPPHPLRSSPIVPVKHASTDNFKQPTQSRRESVDVRTPTKSHEARPRNEEGRGINHSSSGSDLSASSASRWRPRTNSRSRSSLPAPPPKPLYTVQAIRSPAEQFNVPNPSAEASRKLDERVDAFPVASFPNTLLPLRRSVSKETLGTIFSVGSAEYREELTMKRLQGALPAVPTTISEAPKPDSSRRSSLQPSASTPVIQRRPIQRQSYQPQPTYEQHPALHEKLHRDFETQITSFDSVSSSLGKSPYDAAVSSHAAEQRAKSMTAQLEADAVARSHQRQNAPEDKKLDFLRRSTSYDAIINQEPYRESSPNSSHRSSARRPPATHSNHNMRRISQNLGEVRVSPERESMQQTSSGSLREDASMKQDSMNRIRSPPPVSMMNVAKSTKRTPSPSPHHQSQSEGMRSTPSKAAPTVQDKSDIWQRQQSYWAERKQDALKTRKSVEMQRPEKARLNFEMATGIQLKRPVSVTPLRSASGNHYAEPQYSATYDHTYGSYSERKDVPNDGEYYDAQSEDAYVPRGVHQRNASTSEMLGLDGETDFGYKKLPGPVRSVPNYLEGELRRVRVGS